MNDERREIIIIPLLVWAALMALVFVSLGYAYWHGAPARFAVGLAIAAVKTAFIALIFMQLRRASGLVRIASLAGLFFLSLLFFFSFADFLTR